MTASEAAAKETPFWWEAAPRGGIERRQPAATVDVAVVGSGITGLVAALRLAEAGRHVAVFDAAEIGAGASSRNAGFVGRTLKHGFGDLLRRHGPGRAVAVYREMQDAFDAVAATAAAYEIDCGLRTNGRLVLAHTAGQLDQVAAEYRLRREHLGTRFEVVERDDLRREIASDRYAGGVLVPDLAALHPGRYHQGLVAAALRAGVSLHPSARVAGLRREGPGWRVESAAGPTRAREVVIATNGYTDGLLPWLRRRLVPFDAWMIATDELPEALAARVLPRDRTYIDDVTNVDFLRRSPDGRRVLFGGRTGSRGSLPAMARRLLGQLRSILPDLARVGISHAWTGRCAATFDLYPHLGRHEGIHYGVGYCFAGVPMGTHFGRLIADRILGRGATTSVFADRPFPTLPLYRGDPWFVPLVMRWHDWRDGKRHAA
jgi:glycine/D-amino acid oxidase-like deaminating enzyme